MYNFFQTVKYQHGNHVESIFSFNFKTLCTREILLFLHFRNTARMSATLTNSSHLRRQILHPQINCSWWTWTRQSLWVFPSSIQSLFSMCSCLLGKNVWQIMLHCLHRIPLSLSNAAFVPCQLHCFDIHFSWG
jgi:hypothetical protein